LAIKKEKEIAIKIAGSAADSKWAEEIQSLLPEGFDVENFCGKTDLVQLKQMLQGAELVVSNDTSAAHISALSKVPTIALCNGNKYGRFFPYPAGFQRVFSFFPKNDIPVFFPDRLPISEIKPEQVLKKVLEILS
jgi:ADP-heptose:LPS heptosyltransferase